jgi:hypothetical protein
MIAKKMASVAGVVTIKLWNKETQTLVGGVLIPRKIYAKNSNRNNTHSNSARKTPPDWCMLFIIVWKRQEGKMSWSNTLKGTILVPTHMACKKTNHQTAAALGLGGGH